MMSTGSRPTPGPCLGKQNVFVNICHICYSGGKSESGLKCLKSGAKSRNRTGDLLITNHQRI